jgi:acetylglutamate kinase
MIVIKYGGHAMKDQDGLFAKAIQSAVNAGEQCVVVHGGGPQIDAALQKSGITSEFVNGFRLTTPEIFEVVQSVLSGDVLRKVVGHLRATGLNAVGLTGRDGGLIVARPMATNNQGVELSLGRVGEVVAVNPDVLLTLLDAGFLPVIAPVGVQGDEVSEESEIGLNINADLVAGAIAGALKADSLIFLTDVAGIYANWPDESSLIGSITYENLKEMLPTFSGGMIPKVMACLNAVEMGASNIRVIDGTVPESFALALRGLGGTVVTK